MPAVTIEVPDDLLMRATALARQRRCSVNDVFVDATRRAVAALNMGAPISIRAGRDAALAIDRSTNFNFSGAKFFSENVFAPVVKLALRLWPNSEPREVGQAYLAGLVSGLGLVVSYLWWLVS